MGKGCEGFLGSDTRGVPGSAKGTGHMTLGGSTREESVPGPREPGSGMGLLT